MGKIIEGGLIGSESIKQSKTTAIQPKTQVVQSQSQQIPQSQEGFLPWLERNLGGTLEGLLSMPAVIQKVFQPSRQAQEDIFYSGLPEQLREPLKQQIETPSIAQMLPQAYREVVGRPEGFGEPKTIGESIFRYAVPEAALIGTTGGFSSLPAFLRSAAGSLGALGGSELATKGVETFGRKLPEETKERLMFGAALGGGIAGSALTHASINRLSKIAPEKIAKKEINQLKKAKDNLLTERNKQLLKLEDEIRQRQTKIEELEKARHPEYEAAEKIAKQIKAERAPEIENLIEDIERKSGLGIEKAERQRIYDMSNQVLNLIKEGKASLSDAKILKQNINASIYDKNLPPVVKKYYTEMRDAVNEYIDRIGEKFPEHGELFKKAEQKTAEYKKLKEGTQEFKEKQKLEKQRINEEYKQNLQNLNDQYKTAKEQEKLVKTIEKISGKVSNWGTAGLISGIAHLIKGDPIFSGLALASGRLAKGLYNEIRFATKIMKDHPELISEYKSLIKGGIKKDLPKLINKLNKIGENIKILSDKENKEVKLSNKGKIISGGLKF